MAEQRTRFTLDLDLTFRRRLRIMSAIKGITMREYCLGALEKALTLDEAVEERTQPFNEEAVERLTALQKELFHDRKLPGDSTDLIREAREARERAS